MQIHHKIIDLGLVKKNTFDQGETLNFISASTETRTLPY